MIAFARHDTPNASKYLQQLARHFSHKIAVRFDAGSADFALRTGRVRLEAADGALIARVEADDAAALLDAREVIDRHLAVFAFREQLTGLDWQVDG